MVDNELCPSCSQPVAPGMVFCGTCGTRLAAPAAPTAESQIAPADIPPDVDPRLAALGFETDLQELRADTEPPASAVPVAASASEPPAAEWPAPDPAPSAEPWSPLPAPAKAPAALTATLQPSSASIAGSHPAGDSPLLSVGAHPATPPIAPTAAPTPPPPPVARPLLAPVQPVTPTPPPAPAASFAPAPPRVPAPPYQAPAAAAQKSSIPDDLLPNLPVAPSNGFHIDRPQIVTIGLVLAGGVVGLLSLFLAWAGQTGIAVGTTISSPPNAYAFHTPAGIYLLLISMVTIGCAAAPVVVPLLGYPQADEFIRVHARIFFTTAYLVLPMIVGGLFLGVALLYWTLPWGYGTGIFILVVGAALLIAGAVAALWYGPALYEKPAR